MAKGIKTHKIQISSFTKNTWYRQDIYVYYEHEKQHTKLKTHDIQNFTFTHVPNYRLLRNNYLRNLRNI